MKLTVKQWLSSFFKSVLSQKNKERKFYLEKGGVEEGEGEQKQKELEE